MVIRCALQILLIYVLVEANHMYRRKTILCEQTNKKKHCSAFTELVQPRRPKHYQPTKIEIIWPMCIACVPKLCIACAHIQFTDNTFVVEREPLRKLIPNCYLFSPIRFSACKISKK